MINIACENKLYIMNYKLFHSSSVVEQSAVNRSVVGSNPTCGAMYNARSAVRGGGRSMMGNHVDRRRSEGFKSLVLHRGKLLLLAPCSSGAEIATSRRPHGCDDRRGHHLFYFMDIGRISSAGRALALQARGRRFEPCILHHVEKPSYRGVEHVFTCEESIDDETDKR